MSGTEARKVYKQFKTRAEKQGWRVEDRGTHWRFYPPETNLPFVTLHKTPSDRRWKANFTADMRRSGLR